MRKYKKIRLLLIMFMTFIMFSGIRVKAEEYITSQDGAWTYSNLSDGTICLEEYVGDRSVTELQIPSIVDGKTVTMLYKICEGMSTLKKVTIPDTVTSLKFASFVECTSLETINIPDSVQECGAFIFSGCASLKSCTVPNGVTRVGGYMFDGCSSLQSVVIPDSVTEISSYAFYNCKSLKAVQMPKKLSIIGRECFRGSAIESIELPDTVEEIGYMAFYDCVSLTAIKIPVKVKTLYAGTFIGCTSLASAIVPPSVDCKTMFDEVQIFPKTTVLYGHSGSRIAEQAAAYGNPFVEGTYTATVKYKATCTTKGKTEMTCATCGYSYNVYPEATGHHIVDAPLIPASCDASGKTAGYYCDWCGKVEQGMQEIPQIGAVQLSKVNYTYNNKSKKPAVKVTDISGEVIPASNYIVMYSSGRKKVGKYTVTILFNGNYTGKATKSFTIKPKKVSIKKLLAGKKQMTVKWSKQTTQVTGYQVQLATNKTFTKGLKTVTITKNKLITKTIKKLKTKKKYYVRVRTYKTVTSNGKKSRIYSDWSKIKSVKVK